MDFARSDLVEAFLHQHVYKELQDADVCGATVCVVKAGRYPTTLVNCYGFHDVSHGSPLDPRAHLFDLGGCARLLAAAALLRLLQEGDVPLSTDINRLLPQQLQVDTSRFGAVSVQHLLTHTSGLQRLVGAAGGGDGGGGGADEGYAGGGDADAADPLAHSRPLSPVPPRGAPPTAPSPGAGARRASLRAAGDGSAGPGGEPGPADAAGPLLSHCTSSGSSSPEADAGSGSGSLASVSAPTGGAADGEGSGSGSGAVGTAEQPAGQAEPDELLDTPVTAYLLGCTAYGAKPPGVHRPQDLDYMLIGAIIEHLVGEPYDAYLRETLLEPAGVRLPPAAAAAGASANGGAAATAAAADASADGGGGEGPQVWVYHQEPVLLPSLQHQQQQSVQAEPSAVGLVGRAAGGTAGGGVAEGGAGDEVAMPTRRVLHRYSPPPLTPVCGLALPAADIARLLRLFVHSAAPAAAAAAAGEQEEEGAGGAVLGRAVLSALCEIRLSDFMKDVGVAYGGLVSPGLAHTGDGLLALESPPPPPSVREAALLAGRAGSPLPAAPAPSASASASQREPSSLLQVPQASQLQQQQQQPGSRVQSRPATATRREGGVEPARLAAEGAAGGGGGGGAAAAAAVGGEARLCGGGGASLLLLAPHSGTALLIAANTAAPQGAALCRKVATLLLQRFRPAEMPRPAARTWLTALPPPRADPVAALVAFPPAACVAPVGLFEGWPALLPDYLRVHCMQAPGHGLRRDEAPLLRLAKLVPPATAAVAAGVGPDTPLALFGAGLGALWAFEVARRLECLLGRPPLHLFVCGCAGPPCFPARRGGVSYTGGGGEERYDPWRTPEVAQAVAAAGPAPRPASDAGSAPSPAPTSAPAPAQTATGGGEWEHLAVPELFEMPDDVLFGLLRNHPRVPPALRSDVKAMLEHLPVLRADIEVEMSYSTATPSPPLLASVAAVLASVQSRADEEDRLCAGTLSCPITVFIPEEEPSLSQEQAAAWEQVTTGQVRFQSVPGDYHCFEERRGRIYVATAIASTLGRQLSAHTSWLSKLRPAGAGGRWAGGGAGRLGPGSRPGSAVGPGAGFGGGVGAGGGGSGGGAAGYLLPPMYPRG